MGWVCGSRDFKASFFCTKINNVYGKATHMEQGGDQNFIRFIPCHPAPFLVVYPTRDMAWLMWTPSKVAPIIPSALVHWRNIPEAAGNGDGEAAARRTPHSEGIWDMKPLHPSRTQMSELGARSFVINHPKENGLPVPRGHALVPPCVHSAGNCCVH